MKIDYCDTSIKIVPENAQDRAYLESVLGLQVEGDHAVVERVAVSGCPHAWAYARVRKANVRCAHEAFC